MAEGLKSKATPENTKQIRCQMYFVLGHVYVDLYPHANLLQLHSRILMRMSSCNAGEI